MVWLSWLEHHPITEGRGFNSQSGHILRLQVLSPVWACTGGNQSMLLCCIDVPLSPFLSPFLSL